MSRPEDDKKSNDQARIILTENEHSNEKDVSTYFTIFELNDIEHIEHFFPSHYFRFKKQ
jgi:hypothetical protein